MSDENLTPRPLKISKQRRSHVVNPTHRFDHENGLAVLLLPSTSCNISNGGRTMANGAVHHQANNLQIESSAALRRQPSFKHRLFNRMMSGLANRTHIDGIDEQDEQTEHRLSSANTDRQPSRGSATSSDLSIKQLNNLDETLAAFPTPPTSNVTSPSSGRSLQSSALMPKTFSNVGRPLQDVTLAAELRIIPCRDHIANDRSALALVEISTTTNCDLLDYKSHLQDIGLDIAVIIDNSLFNSPASLIASCEIASVLACHLDATTDRMTVLCTVPAGAPHDTSNPSVIIPLSRVNLRRLKAKLDSISVSTAQPDTEIISAVSEDARRILVKSERPASIGEPLGKRFAHVIVLTAHINALSAKDLSHQDLQTHVLCVGLPQQREWENLVCNGWKMCIFNSFLNRGHSSQSRLGRDRSLHGLDNSLRQLTQYARLGKLTGLLTDVVLDIQSQSGYNIEETMGGKAYSRIQIGEVKTVIVKLRPVGHPTSPQRVDAPRWHQFSANSSGDDLAAVLDQILGLPKDGVITAKLEYKHSSLPSNTTCMTSAKCLLQTPLPPLDDQDLVRRCNFSEAKNLLHQHLTDHYATSYKPREALSFLQREFGHGSCKSACPVYVNAVIDELRYQARISERLSLQNSPKKLLPAFEEPHPGIRIIEELNTPSFYAKDYKPKEWISVMDEDIFAPGEWCPPPATVADQLGLDDASKIWNDLRKMSRGDENGNGRKTSSTTMRRRNANKSGLTNSKWSSSNVSVSVAGSSARRSFSTPVRSSSIRGSGGGNGLSAPWL